MIGRYSDDKGLTVGGVGTSPYWGYAVPESMKKTSLRIRVDSTGMGPSDHASFYLQNIPVLSFFTGVHADYHKPSDDADKINYLGQAQIIDFIKEIISRMEKVDKAPFTTTTIPQTMSAQSSFKVTMGVIPDYSYDKKGLRLDGVTEGRPAANAGIKTSDVLIQLGHKSIDDIQDYMEALGEFEKGQTVKAIILRAGKPIQVSVTF
jgi:C-terminal processing protease CtpA/Prc